MEHMPNPIYMQKAIDAAYKAIKHFEAPFGCCIVNGSGETIATYNSCILDLTPISHAEINAINSMCRKMGCHNLDTCVLYATTQPCLMCLGAILWSGIRTVYYGCSLDTSIQYGFSETGYDFKKVIANAPYLLNFQGGYMVDECRALYQKWEQRNKIRRIL